MPVGPAQSGRTVQVDCKLWNGLTQKRQALATDMALRTAKNKVFS